MNTPRPQIHPRRGGFRFYFWSLGLGAALATAFITFAPSALSPDAIRKSFAGILNPKPGALGPVAPFKLPIGLIAGHSGNDSGATCNDGLTEVSINEDVALRVKTLLERQGYIVDVLQEYDDRLGGYKGMALISIHTDTCRYIDDNATGFIIQPSSVEAAADASQQLAACLADRYAAATELQNHSASVASDMINYHAFHEINPATPAVIIELGFLFLDRDLLQFHADRVAQGIADGLICFTRGESANGNGTPTP
jgi:N-acetylmuramoyl-L-alanine amidase